MHNRTKVLIVTGDTLGKTMAGPGIRAVEMAKAISQIADVKLLSTVRPDLSHPDFEVVNGEDSNLKPFVSWCDVLIFQGALLSTHPYIAKTNKIIVADLYDPMHLEHLEQQKNANPGIRYIETIDLLSVMNEQIARADFFICASEKQRDFWLGQLAAMGRLNPATYDADNSLRNLIDVVPFGIQDTPAVRTKQGIKGVIAGIAHTDKVILWGGGIYNWFDPLTLIRAVAKLHETHPEVRLVFMGTQHPNPHVPEMAMSFAARELAKELDPSNKIIFFNEGWVPYEERANFLLDADIGVSTHFDHLETSFSFRTRILDYIWAGLPIVATRGDTFEEVIRNNRIGTTVSPENVNELALAIEEVIYGPPDKQIESAIILEYSKKLVWQESLRNLMSFMVAPHHAADHGLAFSKNVLKWITAGRRSPSHRLFVFTLNSKKNGFGYALMLFLKNALGRTYRKLKVLFSRR